MNLTPAQLHTLRHMLGINTPEDRDPKSYRNHYAAGQGDHELAELERLGAVEFRGERYGLKFYSCTDRGRETAIKSHKAIRYGKPRSVYLRFLKVADAYPDLTFKEFLTSPKFRESRRIA